MLSDDHLFTNIGIDSFGFYAPIHFVKLEELALKRGVDPAKYAKGLLSKEMRVVDVDEDIISLGLKAGYNALVNEEQFRLFVADIAFYVVMFNSIALIQEDNGKYGMIASQKELFTADYVFQLGNPRLSTIGQQIIDAYQSGWNIDNEDNIVWDYGDCWPIYLFNDARGLIGSFNKHFLRERGTISKLKNF